MAQSATAPAIRSYRSRMSYTVTFLRMAAAEMHKLADNIPEIARELRHVADALQGEADDLVGHFRDCS